MIGTATPQGRRSAGARGAQHSHPPPLGKAQSLRRSSPDPAGHGHAGCAADHGPVRAGCGPGPGPGLATGGAGHAPARADCGVDGGGGAPPWTEAWRGAGGMGRDGSGGGGCGPEEAAPSAACSQHRDDS